MSTPHTKPRLMILVKDDVTGELHRVTGEEAMLLEAFWDTVPDDDHVTTAGVGALRMRLGWARARFDRVRYALHSHAHQRLELLHEPHRHVYETRAGEVRASTQAFDLRPLVRSTPTCIDQETPEA